MRRRELFEIQRYARVYDRREGKFIIDISYKTRSEVTPRTIQVAEAFGLGVDDYQQHVLYDNVQLRIRPTDVVYITGDSGSGKSVLLRAFKKDLRAEAVDMADVEFDPTKPLIDTIGKTFNEGLELLSRVGLNDAFLFVRRYDQLSDGQREDASGSVEGRGLAGAPKFFPIRAWLGVLVWRSPLGEGEFRPSWSATETRGTASAEAPTSSSTSAIGVRDCPFVGLAGAGWQA